MDNNARPDPQFEQDELENRALAAAVEQARADRRGVPHEDMRQWLQKIAEGDFAAAPPVPLLP